MKKILKSTLVVMFALLLTFTTSTRAFAHSPTDPDNSSFFTVIQHNYANGWNRGYIFETGLWLPNDGPLFLADAVNNWDWQMTRPGTLYVHAAFENKADYRILVISPNGSQIYFDQTYYNSDNIAAYVHNLNPGYYRALIFNNSSSYFFLYQYTVSATYN